MYRTGNGLRMAALIRLGQEVVRVGDLAVIWRISDRNTLYTTLKRYTQKGLLFRIYKGLYALKPLNELDPVMLGLKGLHRFAYVSTETVLVRQGIIPQKMPVITLISDISKRFSIGPYRYVSRKINDARLYNPAGLSIDNGIKTATPARAIADLLYFNPRAYFDGSVTVNWQSVRALQKQIGYPLTPHRYDTSKSKRRAT